MPRSDGLRILEFEKNSGLRFGLGRSKSIFGARRGETSWGLRNVPRVCWVSESRADDVRTVSIVRNCVSLSPLMSENFKLKKVNKNFVPEPKESRQSVSSVSWIPMPNERFRTFYIFVCICTFHILISGYVTLIQIIFKRSIWPRDETLTGTTIMDQNGPESNVNEEVTPFSSEFQNWSLTTGNSLVAYPVHLLLYEIMARSIIRFGFFV